MRFSKTTWKIFGAGLLILVTILVYGFYRDAQWFQNARAICRSRLETCLAIKGYEPGEVPPVLGKDNDLETMKYNCAKFILKGLEPCTREYTPGTDSALQCIDRYTKPIVEELNQYFFDKIPHKAPKK
jgi:hypothetical protein